MATSTAVAPASVNEYTENTFTIDPDIEETDELTQLRYQAFKREHLHGIERECDMAVHYFGRRPRHSESGVLLPLVLPIGSKELKPIRTEHRSYIFETFEGVECEKLQWLKLLLKKHCPEGLTVRVTCDTAIASACTEHKENVYAPVIWFYKD